MLARALLAILPLVLAPAAYAAPSGGKPMPSTVPSGEIDVARSYQEGLAALEAGDFATAERKFADVLSKTPDNPEAHYYIARAKLGRDDATGALGHLRQALAGRTGFVEARELLALTLVASGDSEAARAELAALEAQRVGCAAPACDAAKVQDAIARVEAALAASEADVQGSLRPRDPMMPLFIAAPGSGAPAYDRAVRRINEGRYQDAIEALEAAAADIGPHPDILNYLGYAHRKTGRFAEAETYYRRALALDPDHLGANEYLGELYVETGALEKAEAQLARLDALCAFGCAEREDLARILSSVR